MSGFENLEGPRRRCKFEICRSRKPILEGTGGTNESFRSVSVNACPGRLAFEERNIAHYWEPYRPYKEICELSLGEAFAHFGIRGNPSLIRRYFDAFRGFELYPDVLPTLDVLGRRHRLAIVSNIDDDLLVATPLGREFDLVCTAERARGYKPDGILFRYLMAHSGVSRDEILHVGQSQFTDMVGGKPL